MTASWADRPPASSGRTPKETAAEGRTSADSRHASLAKLREQFQGVIRTGAGVVSPAAQRWTIADLTGRIVELSADSGHDASLTVAAGLVGDAQRIGETVAWVAARESMFFPPDVAAAGVDLDTLVVVRVPGVQAAARATDKLMRSGGFGLVVMDLGDGAAAAKGLTPAFQGRLQGLAQKHSATVLCLTQTRPGASSLGPLVSLRVRSERRREAGGLVCELHILKDKRRTAGWTQQEVVHGPAGLR